MRIILYIILFLQPLAVSLSAQEWVVPEERKGRLSNFPFDDATRKAGGEYYSNNCMSCHGSPGKADYLNLVPPPGDPATEKIQKNNDGELFYKVTEGRGQMPSFKNVLSSKEVWNIISYIRSFNKNYRQKIMPVITASAYPGAEIKLKLLFNRGDSAIVLQALALKDNLSRPVINAGVRLSVQRTFGFLPLDEEKITADNGSAIFRLPGNLPGDTAGNITVRASFTNEEIFGSESVDTLLSAGSVTTPVSLIAERAMWNTVRMAPLWIILTFTLGLLAVWGFIMLVLMKLRDIFIIGDSVLKGKLEKDPGSS